MLFVLSLHHSYPALVKARQDPLFFFFFFWNGSRDCILANQTPLQPAAYKPLINCFNFFVSVFCSVFFFFFRFFSFFFSWSTFVLKNSLLWWLHSHSHTPPKKKKEIDLYTLFFFFFFFIPTYDVSTNPLLFFFFTFFLSLFCFICFICVQKLKIKKKLNKTVYRFTLCVKHNGRFQKVYIYILCCVYK